jgi:hypothetical protein
MSGRLLSLHELGEVGCACLAELELWDDQDEQKVAQALAEISRVNVRAITHRHPGARSCRPYTVDEILKWIRGAREQRVDPGVLFTARRLRFSSVAADGTDYIDDAAFKACTVITEMMLWYESRRKK